MKRPTMKRMLLGTATVLAALSGFAQGQVLFNNNVPGVVVTHVYAPPASEPWLSQIGNGTNDYPPGTTDWSAFRLIPLMPSGQYGADSTRAQLLGAPGFNMPEYALLPGSPVTTFRSPGHVAPVTVTFPNILPDAAAATIQMVVWDNSSGKYPTWTEARLAWMNGLIGAGTSNPFNVSALGGSINTPPNLTGLLSFNVYVIPEPSTFALGGLAAAVLMIARRRR
jgi:hypothetical protein